MKLQKLIELNAKVSSLIRFDDNDEDDSSLIGTGLKGVGAATLGAGGLYGLGKLSKTPALPPGMVKTGLGGIGQTIGEGAQVAKNAGASALEMFMKKVGGASGVAKKTAAGAAEKFAGMFSSRHQKLIQLDAKLGKYIRA